MPINFPDNPSDGDIFEGYVYDATRDVWDIKLIADQNLEDLDNVNVTAPTDGQALIYDDANSEWIAGDVSTGPQPAKIIDSNSINIDFSDGIELEKRSVTGNVTFTGSNYTSGVHKTIYLEGDTVQRTLTFPNDWTFITDKPTAIGASKNNILDLNSFGTSASTTVGIWLGQSSFEPIIATGGTETEIIVAGVTYKVHTFTTSGTLLVTNSGSIGKTEYLIVGGGGGGGNGSSTSTGGGGAGGSLTNVGSTGFDITPQSYNVVVGLGGVASNGGDSSVFGITANGGGRGGAFQSTGQSGGSGGGGGRDGSSAGNGIVGQGNNGGGTPFGPWQGGGGGGGALTAGGTGGGTGDQSLEFAGNGGDGIASSITGATVIYATGGGGGTYSSNTLEYAKGLGGNAGINGGNGQKQASPTRAATNGLNGRGAGGGGGADTIGANGGSGIVVIRYPITDPN